MTTRYCGWFYAYTQMLICWLEEKNQLSHSTENGFELCTCARAHKIMKKTVETQYALHGDPNDFLSSKQSFKFSYASKIISYINWFPPPLKKYYTKNPGNLIPTNYGLYYNSRKPNTDLQSTILTNKHRPFFFYIYRVIT